MEKESDVAVVSTPPPLLMFLLMFLLIVDGKPLTFFLPRRLKFVSDLDLI